MKKERFKITPAVYLIIVKDNKVLLSRRYDTGWEDGKYSLVSGHVEAGESATAAMVREAKEEAGITINPKDLKLVHTMHRMSTEERIDLFFSVSKWKGTPHNMEPDRCDDMQWFDLNDLPRNLIDCMHVGLKNSLSGIVYSEIGWHEG